MAQYGDSQTFTITPDPGYMISKILVDEVAIPFVSAYGDKYKFTNIKGNHTIKAFFVVKPKPVFIVNAIVSVYSGYATVTPKEQTVKQGSPASIKIIPDPGHHISDLTDNKVKVPLSKIIDNRDGTYTYTIPAVYEDHKIVLYLEKSKYIIKAKAGNGGSITPSGNVLVSYGSDKVFTITPDEGYKIGSVIVDGKSITPVSNSYKFVKVKSNHTIAVTFDKIPAMQEKIIVVVLQINNPNISVNGISKPINAQGSKPVIKNSRTLLPIRSLVESLGGKVVWDPRTRQVEITLNGNRIVLTIGKNTALVNGIKTPIDAGNPDVKPIIINGRTYLPLRFIAEHLGCNIDWDGSTKTITIYYFG